MIDTITGDIRLNAFTVAASAVAEAMSKSKKLRRQVADANSLDPMAHDHKNTAQTAELDLPQLVPMNVMRTDGGTQARMTTNESVVKEYAEALEEGAKLPPIVVFYEQDKDVYWLADGFHRFEAHRVIGRIAIWAVVKEGTQRDAKLHAVGANSTHGLRRTNADKRHAVTMLLSDPVCIQWSDREIAKACDVSHMLVANVRREHLEEMPDSPTAPAIRTVTRNGTTYEQKVKAKPADDQKPSNPTELAPADSEPTIATSPLSQEQVKVAVANVDELAAQNAALRAENSNLRARLEDLAVQLQEAMTCHDEMHTILQASVPLDKVQDQLRQALELNQMLEIRVAEAPRRYAEAQCKQDAITRYNEDEAVVYDGEHNAS